MISSSIPATLVYGVYFSQLVRYYRWLCPKQWFPGQRCVADTKATQTSIYVAYRLKSSLQKIYSRHHVVVDRYELPTFLMTKYLFSLCRFFPLTLTRLFSLCRFFPLTLTRRFSLCTFFPLTLTRRFSWCRFFPLTLTRPFSFCRFFPLTLTRLYRNWLYE